MMPLNVRYFLACIFSVLLVPLSISAIAQQLPSQGSLDVDRLGAAVYAYPISALDGAGGVKPNIAALYNSQAPNGILGKGGSISGLSVIKRCQQTLVRDGQNKSITWGIEDRFCIDAQRLMLVAGTQGAMDSQYKTEIDNGVVYTAKGGIPGNPDYFEAKATDGAVLLFGSVSSAKELGATTMTWALTQYQDINKNTIEYLYEGTAADGLRIKRINYAFFLPTTTTNPDAYIEFEYKDREDPISKYVTGYEFRNNKLLSKINTYGVLGLLYRSYQFDVATSNGLAGYVSRWQSVKECTALTVCADATQFEWGRTQKNITTSAIETKNIKMDFLGEISRNLGNRKTAQFPTDYNNCPWCVAQSVDLNGNGVADFFWIELFENGSYGYVSSNDGASLPSDAPKYPWSLLATKYDYGSEMPPLEFADINADGFPDVITPLQGNDYSDPYHPWGVTFTSRQLSIWRLNDYRQFGRHHIAKPIDLNGDGFQEILGIDQRSVAFTLHKTKRDVREASSSFYYRGLDYQTTSLHLSDIPNANSIFVEYRSDMTIAGDFNNDGKQDLLILVKLGYPSEDKQVYKINWYEQQGSQLVFKETIYHESRVPLDLIALPDGGYKLAEFVAFEKAKSVDINGDGLDDVAIKKNGIWMYSINKGNGFLPFVTLPMKPGFYAPISATFIDANNDGNADYIYGENTYSPTADYGKTAPSIYVRYWSSKLGAFDEPVLLRITSDYPVLFADMNGDGFVDIVENHRDEKDKNKETIKVFGFTNGTGNSVAGFQGVLDQDTITSVKTGVTVNASIDYQTLIKPKKIDILNCTGGHTGMTPCYDFSENSQYKPLKIDVPHKANSLDAEAGLPPSTGLPYYYSKINEPFLGLNNPYAGSARVSQYVAPLPIVTRVINNSIVSSDKKYYYEIMRTQAGGRGILGFEKTAVVDTLTGTKLETSWRLDWPFTGIPSSQVLWNKNGFAINEKDFTLFLPASENKNVFSPYIFKTLGKSYDTTIDSQYQGRLLNVSDSATVSISKPTLSSGSATSSASSSVAATSKPEKIELIFPNEGAVINIALGNSVNLRAVALMKNGNLWTNASGFAPKLKFVVDNYSSLGESVSGATPLSWTPSAQGVYAIHVEMLLDDGTVLKSRVAGVNVIPKNGYPHVNFDVGMRNGNYYSTAAIINLRAAASDFDGTISHVSFYVNDQLVANKFSPDSAGGYYRFDWSSTASGVYKLRSTAQDDLGNISQSKTVEIYYGVSNSSSSASSSSASSIYPQLSPALPSKIYTSTVGDDIYISSALWSASNQLWVNNDGTNAQAVFFANDAYVGTAKAIGAWTIFKPKSAATYEIIAAANLPDASQVVSDKSVLLLKNDAAPSINLTAPLYWGSTFNLNEFVPISADVTLNAISISKVTFYANDIEIGTDFNFPYSIAWLPSNEGDYLIKAVVEDSKGNTAISTQRQIKYGLSLSSSNSSKAYVVPPASSSSSATPNVAEKIVLVSPLPGRADTYGLGADVVLSAYVLMAGGGEWLDQNGKLARIDYYANGKLLTDLKQYGGSFRFWTPTATGNYTIKAVAYLDNNKTIEVTNGGVNIIKVGAPVVSLTSPSATQTFMKLGDSLTFFATASDPNNNLSGVQFSINGEIIGGKLSASGSYNGTWSPVLAGNYQVSAIAMNTSYVKTTSPSVMVTVIDTANAELTKPTFLSVDGLENVITGVDTDGSFTLRWSGSIVADYYVLTEGDTEIYKGVEFSKSLQLKLGTYNFKLKACQAKPARCSEEVLKTIKVNTANNGAANNVVDLTIPAPDRQQVGSSGQQFALYAEAKTSTGDVWRAADGTAATMTYYANGIKLNSLTSDSTGALKFTELTQPGTYSITAEAILDDGTKVTSDVGSVTVKSNSAPVVSMTAPINQQRIAEGKAVKLSANITDADNNLAQVMFLVNGAPIGKAITSTPYELQWTPPALGAYSVSVRAIDSGGLQTQSPNRTLVVEPLSNVTTPTEFLSPDYSPLSNATKVLRAEGEVGDVLVIAPPNPTGVSYNAFTKFVMGQPLKIMNVDNSAAGSPAAKLIIIDAQLLTLNNTLEIVGAAADVLLINRITDGQIQCLYCDFVNVGRVTLAAAQPKNTLSANSTQIGELVASGAVNITKLNAPAAQVEVMGKTITTVKNDAIIGINTQQKARLSTNGYVLDVAGDKHVGTGSVNLISGDVNVDYSNFNVLSFSSNASTAMASLNGNIRSGAIKVVAASSLTINSQLSTHSDLQASFLDKGEFKFANERIELVTLDNINGDLINNGTLLSDDKIKLIATGDIQNSAIANVTANHIEVIAGKNITNMGVFVCPDSVCAPIEQPVVPLVTNLYFAAEGVIDNQNALQGFTNLTLTAGQDLNNRFGGTIEATNVYLNSKDGSIRNGWATPYEDLPESHWILQPSAYTQQLSTFDQFILPKINGSQTPAKKVRTKEAYILGEKVIVNAKRHVENINPSLDVYRSGTATPKEDGTSANTVSISALNRLEIRAHGYILNSSASLSVEGNTPTSAMVLIAPQVHNERYFMYVLGDVVNEQGVVIDTSGGTQTTTTTTGTNLEARLYVYSPAGVIFSNAPTQFRFDEVNNLASLFVGGIAAATKTGFENNTSYFMVENDVEFKGAGSQVRSKGVLLERENYYLKKTVVTKDLNCTPGKVRLTRYIVKNVTCQNEVNTINKNPLGETIAETIERTVFAVSGQLLGAPANFVGINENPLDRAKERFVEEYKKEVVARLSSDASLLKGTPYEMKLLGIETLLTNGVDGPYIFTSVRYKYLYPENIPVPAEMRPTEVQKGESKSIWDIVVEGFASLKAKFLAFLDEFEKEV